MVRVVAAAVVSVPILLLLAAETRLAAYASAWLLGQPESLMAAVVVTYATVVVIAGGMRSLTWSSVAKGIAAILALAVLATIIAVMLSNLPLPQLTHGNMLRVLTRMEIARGVPIVVPEPLTLDLPGTGIEPIAKRFLQTFGGVGSVAFLLMSFIVAAGVAASPVLLPRCGTTPGVYESRKSLGWAVLIVGLVLLTLPAIAVYLRAMLVEQVVGQTADHLPAWFQVLQRAGVARLEANVPVVALGNVGFERDAVLFALPIAGGFPQVLIYLALAGALAASLAALAAALLVISTILAEDVVHGLRNDIVPDGLRIGTVRIAVLGAAVVTVWLAMAAPADPLQLFLYALTFTAAACFPVLLLSIWWKRINAWGALASMIGGFAITAFVVLLGETGASPLPGVLAAAVGAPVAIAIAVVVSLMTPVPGRNLLDVVREIRIPGGETIHDRELRLQRLKNRGPA
jgi:cation/acetate symporter